MVYLRNEIVIVKDEANILLEYDMTTLSSPMKVSLESVS